VNYSAKLLQQHFVGGHWFGVYSPPLMTGQAQISTFQTKPEPIRLVIISVVVMNSIHHQRWKQPYFHVRSRIWKER